MVEGYRRDVRGWNVTGGLGQSGRLWKRLHWLVERLVLGQWQGNATL